MLADILILAIVAAVFILCLRKVLAGMKKGGCEGCGGCGGSCGGSCSSCHQCSPTSKKS